MHDHHHRRHRVRPQCRPRSHARGYKLDLRTHHEGACLTPWIKTTQHKGSPRGNDPRWHGNLDGISLDYVYEAPRRGGVHWDITFVWDIARTDPGEWASLRGPE
ncbi:hypothetical protein ACFQ51_43080 [Streptomyces kaempferi]